MRITKLEFIMQKGQNFSPATVDYLQEFAKPAVNAGLVPKEELNSAIRSLKNTIRESAEPPENKAQLLTAAEVAEKLRVSKRTVFRLADTNVLTRVHLRPNVAKSVRFRSDEVDAIIDGSACE